MNCSFQALTNFVERSTQRWRTKEIRKTSRERDPFQACHVRPCLWISQCLLHSLEYRGMADCSAAITGYPRGVDTTRMQGRNYETKDRIRRSPFTISLRHSLLF